MYAWLHDAIADGAEVLTANQRLSRELRAAFDLQQLAAGRKAWLTPPIHSWHTWLSAKADEAFDRDAIILDRNSAAIVWDECLRLMLKDQVLNRAGLEKQTFRDWQLANDWRISIDDLLASAVSADELLFANTAVAYRQRLEDQSLIDPASVASLVADLLGNERVPAPRRVVLAGFDRVNPATQLVAEALRVAGCAVDIRTEEAPPGTTRIAVFENELAEFRAAGAWARSYIGEQPDARIAIVVPALEKDSIGTRNLVLEGLAPGWQIGGKFFRDSVNVSYGRQLADYPAIETALLLLRWVAFGLSSKQLASVLRSRCIGDGDIAVRSKLELALRNFPDRNWDPGSFARTCRALSHDSSAVPFIEALNTVESLSAGWGDKVGPAVWASRFDELLSAFRWPGTEALDSEEFQLINRWRKLLNEFSRTEAVAPELAIAEANGRLATMSGDVIYQEEMAAESVQLIGTLEAAGMRFDAVWIAGMDAVQWPPQHNPSPFISRRLQRRCGMPDADPANSVDFARSILQRLVASTRQCVISWSRFRDDTELTASPLLDELRNDEALIAEDPGWFAGLAIGQDTTETISRDFVPPVAADEQIYGGAGTVQRQSVEPLAAFASGRLGAGALESISAGLSAKIRGTLLHDSLHNLFTTIPDRDALRRMSGEERRQRIGSAIDEPLGNLAEQADGVTRHILSLERGRLFNLLTAFLAEENEREYFSIAAVEAEAQLIHGNVTLTLRIDRIDRLADGSTLIIDYKSGAGKSLVNREGDPADLQLLVYAAAIGGNIGGLSFINIDTRKISYSGAGGSIAWSKKDSADWQEILPAWMVLTRRTIDEFAAGDARINLAQTTEQSRPLQILSRCAELKREL